MLVIVAPGQGAQRPGMLGGWLDDPAAATEVAAWSELTGLDLVTLGTTADAGTVQDTAHAQPLLVTLGLLSATALATRIQLPREQLGDVLAGHSVGELTAAALAGVVTDDEAVQLVALRGAAMARAAADSPGGMSAVLGGDPVTVSERLVELGLTPANVNAAGQVVAAGPLHLLEQLSAHPPAGARVRPLPVAGAFHTGQMATAAVALTEVARQIAPAAPSAPVVANADGMAYVDGPSLLSTIVGQVAAPVRWDACQRTFAALGVTGLLELAPGGTLTGLARRELPAVATFAVKSPGDLDAAAAFVAEHRSRTTVPSAPRAGADPGADSPDAGPKHAGPKHAGPQQNGGSTPATRPGGDA